MKIDVVILAAGKGTRMCSALPKVLHEIGAKPMVSHVIDAAAKLQLNDDVCINLVVGFGADKVQNQLGDSFSYVEQKEQLGTGHAVAQALPLLRAGSQVLILYGDVPLIQTDTLKALLSLAGDDSMSLLTAFMESPTGYGRIVRNESTLITSIVEQKDASADQLKINEVNTGIMCVAQEQLAQWLPKLSNDNAQAEYYLTDIIAMAVAQGVKVSAAQPDSNMEIEGVNNKVQLAALERAYQIQQAEKLMTEGATLADPNRIDIRGSVSVGSDVFIDVNVIFEGNVTLGDNVSIGPNCLIKNSSLGKGTQVYANTLIEDSKIYEQCSLGPFARIRPATVLADGAKIGNFVEVKKSNIGKQSKVNHLSYIGDSDIGEGCNIGAGTITCNYDGANKSKTTMGNGVFIGSNSTLVAPLDIADKSFVAAGSTITKNISEGKLAIARNKQKSIDGWKRPTKAKS